MPALEKRELTEDAAFLHQVVDALAFGVIVVDAAFERIHLINQAAERLLSTLGAPPGRLPPEILRAVSAAPTRVTLAGRVALLRLGAMPGRPDRVILTLSEWDTDVVDVLGLLHRRYGLSSRELQVVRWVRAGLRNREIADRMELTVATVKTYVGNVFAAVHVRNRTELVSLIERLAAGRS